LYKSVLPFIAIMVLGLIIMILVPSIITWLPNAMIQTAW
jgi:TRAP-type C4-dicarboxylate transport system permease large subunit